VYFCAVALAADWQRLADGLPAGWKDAHVRLELQGTEQRDRAAALLAPAQPVRSGPAQLTLHVAARGHGARPETVRRLLEQLDRERLRGVLTLEPGEVEAEPGPLRPEGEPTLPESWDAALATLPSDWSDLLGEIELVSSDHLERAALHLSPINPRRDGTRVALRFRSARLAGYGASAGMVRRCLERCAEDGIRGRVEVLRALSDTRPVQTQGPTWLLSGRTV
jgi:hypothetical protein